MENSQANSASTNEGAWSILMGSATSVTRALNTEIDSLLANVWDKVWEGVPRRVVVDSEVDDAMAHFLMRCVTRFRAMKILISEGHCEDAFLLARQLMNETHRVMYLASLNDHDRAATTLDYWNKMITNREHWIRAVDRHRNDPDVDQMRAQVRESRRKVEAARTRLGVGKLRPFPDEGTPIITALDRLAEDMPHYLMLASGFHVTAMLRFITARKRDDGMTAMYVATDNPRLRVGVAEYAVEFVLEAAIAGLKLVPGSSDITAELEVLKTEARETLERIADRAP